MLPRFGHWQREKPTMKTIVIHVLMALLCLPKASTPEDNNRALQITTRTCTVNETVQFVCQPMMTDVILWDVLCPEDGEPDISNRSDDGGIGYLTITCAQEYDNCSLRCVSGDTTKTWNITVEDNFSRHPQNTTCNKTQMVELDCEVIFTSEILWKMKCGANTIYETIPVNLGYISSSGRISHLNISCAPNDGCHFICVVQNPEDQSEIRSQEAVITLLATDEDSATTNKTSSAPTPSSGALAPTPSGALAPTPVIAPPVVLLLAIVVLVY